MEETKPKAPKTLEQSAGYISWSLKELVDEMKKLNNAILDIRQALDNIRL